MGILDEDVIRVRETADIVAVISAHTQLRKTGVNWTGLCPFHGEKSPSFSVNPDKGVFYCFGCQAKGDVISFVRDMDHLDFAGAVEFLASKSGVALRYTDRDGGERREARGALREAMVAAVDWYHDRLLTGADAGAARRYLRDRGFDGERVRQYRIGWAPDGWDTLVRSLKFTPKVLRDAGLGIETKHGKTNDFFRERILFPIFDPQGDPIGFGGRMMPEGRPPKYKNTPETALYRKSKVLYGLNWAKDEAVRTNEVIICEGYTDVIGFAEVGLDRAVATCGTALTDEHVRTLQRFAPKLVLAFDPDAAGQAAADRVYEWERKHEVQVAVADLPKGGDPADLARTDPDRLRLAVEAAKPFLQFRLDRIFAAADLKSVEGRGRAAEVALTAIAEHPSEFVQDQYLMMVADQCHLESDKLRATLKSGNFRALQRKPTERKLREREDTPDTEALRLAIANPDEVLPLLHRCLFDGRARSAYEALADNGGDFLAAVESSDPLVSEMLARLAVEEIESDPVEVRRMLLRRLAQRQQLELQRLAMAEMEQPTVTAGDTPTAVELQRWLRERVEAIGPDSPPDPVGEDELLGWLAHRVEETP